MIRHVVIWTLNDPADAPRFQALLDSCRGLVDGMNEFETGIRSDGLEANADVLLVSTFRDTAALAAYLQHPHHQAVAAQLGPLRASRCVLDHEMSPRSAA